MICRQLLPVCSFPTDAGGELSVRTENTDAVGVAAEAIQLHEPSDDHRVPAAVAAAPIRVGRVREVPAASTPCGDRGSDRPCGARPAIARAWSTWKAARWL